MATQKKLTKRLLVDVAERSHGCHNNKTHQIRKGSKRLKVTEGRSAQHYCIECAKKFLATGIEELGNISSQLC